MGLDIDAYSHLTALGPCPCPDSEDHYENHMDAYAYECFSASFLGLPVLRIETSAIWGDKTQFLQGGCYATTDQSKVMRFPAGSYGGYNLWRARLQELYNPELLPDGPFYELIWFADNEGCIGPVAALNLLADFREHAGTYQRMENRLDPFHDFHRACELAADGGLIRFG
jgi:hypothetical protein